MPDDEESRAADDPEAEGDRGRFLAEEQVVIVTAVVVASSLLMVSSSSSSLSVSETAYTVR